MVGDRQRVHAQLFGAADHAFDRAGSIQKTVMAMAMQMSKRQRSHSGSLPQRAGSSTTPKLTTYWSFYRYACAIVTSLKIFTIRLVNARGIMV